MKFYSDPIFQELLNELFKEPFAVNHQFREKDLERVCQEVERAYPSAEGRSESYQKTRNVLCLLLCHLEIYGVTEMPQGHLGHWLKEAA